MNLANYFSPSNIVLLRDCENKENILREISIHASDLCGVSWRDIYSLLSERERLGSTGVVGKGVACPHARVPKLDKIIILVAKVSPAVDFGVIDLEPVDITFVTLVPADESVPLGVSAGFSVLMRNSELMSEIRSKDTTKEIFDIISREFARYPIS